MPNHPPPRLVDSHAHLGGREFDADRGEVLERARAAGVTPLVVVGAGGELAELERAIALAESEPDVWAAVAFHPHDAGRIPEGAWRVLERMLGHPRVVAVGETGLDYHYHHSTPDEQRAALRRHLALARAAGKPVVYHVREAHADMQALLAEEQAGLLGGVIHCFSGGPAEASAYVAMGLHVSFSGVVTFPGRSADPVREAVRAVPLDRLLVETDCPYLAPVPHRGRRNEPALVTLTAEAVARAAGVPLDELCAAAVANASALFRLTL